MKTPHVKVSASFYLKDAAEGQLGLRQVSWTFGKKPVPLGELLGAIVYRLLEFYISVLPTPTDEINAELEKFREALSTLVVEEKEQDPLKLAGTEEPPFDPYDAVPIPASDTESSDEEELPF